MAAVSTQSQAQTRIVPVQGFEADSIECANVGNKKFHSAVRGYASTNDVNPKYALISQQGKGRWTLEPLAELGVGTQSEYWRNTGTYGHGERQGRNSEAPDNRYSRTV